MSTFGGLSAGVSGLEAAQRALDIAGENITNQGTVGYSRQQVQTQAVGSSTVPAIWARASDSSGGVAVTGVIRVTDDLLSQRLATATGNAALSAGQQSSATALQVLFAEPGENGLQAKLSTLWSSFGDLANDPTNDGVRSAVMGAATDVTDAMSRVSQGFTSLWSDNQQSLASTVADANAAATQIAGLNARIAAANGSNEPANDLADQRDGLVQHLAQTMGATMTDGPNGTVNVFVGGTALVSGAATLKLAVTGPAALSQIPGGQAGTVSVTVAANGTPVQVTGGDAGAALDALDRQIPARRDAMDAVAKGVADQVNALQAGGYDKTGAAASPFFTGTTAATLSVALTSGAGIAASSAPPVGGVASRDGTIANEMSELGSTGTADSAYRTVVSTVGSAVQNTTRAAAADTAVQASVQSALSSVSGVSVDEETASLVQYQRAYEGSAKFISVLDQVFATLINSVS